MKNIRSVAIVATMLLASTGVAHAQPVDAWIDLQSDDRRRGLSWSGGRAALSAGAGVSIGPALRFDASVATARSSDRHGGADAAIDMSLGYSRYLGPIRWDAVVIGHAFPGATDAPGWIEVGTSAGLAYGPVTLDVSGRYAPAQSAIGGDNLYVGAELRAGIPATPFSVRAAGGRSTGSVDDAIRAARLRPSGAYWNWLVGVERVSGPFSVALDYVGTDIGREQASPFAETADARDMVVARVSYRF